MSVKRRKIYGTIYQPLRQANVTIFVEFKGGKNKTH